jgi:hypothetical protein
MQADKVRQSVVAVREGIEAIIAENDRLQLQLDEIAKIFTGTQRKGKRAVAKRVRIANKGGVQKNPEPHQGLDSSLRPIDPAVRTRKLNALKKARKKLAEMRANGER